MVLRDERISIFLQIIIQQLINRSQAYFLPYTSDRLVAVTSHLGFPIQSRWRRYSATTTTSKQRAPSVARSARAGQHWHGRAVQSRRNAADTHPTAGGGQCLSKGSSWAVSNRKHAAAEAEGDWRWKPLQLRPAARPPAQGPWDVRGNTAPTDCCSPGTMLTDPQKNIVACMCVCLQDGDIHRHMYLQDLYISDKDDKPAVRYESGRDMQSFFFQRASVVCVTVYNVNLRFIRSTCMHSFIKSLLLHLCYTCSCDWILL